MAICRWAVRCGDGDPGIDPLITIRNKKRPFRTFWWKIRHGCGKVKNDYCERRNGYAYILFTTWFVGVAQKNFWLVNVCSCVNGKQFQQKGKDVI